MCADDDVVDTVVVAQLYSDSSTQRREHLCDYDLLVPDRLITSFLHTGLALKRGVTFHAKLHRSTYTHDS